MVIGAFPAAKLGVLAIKQISKPIANIIKSKAKEHPLFRNYVCMPPAQLYNWVEVKTKMWALNLGKPVNVPPLTEAMAVELGANLLGEFIIFAIGAGLLIFEYARQTSNEAKKLEKAKLEKDELTNRLAEMTFRLERQDAQLREMTRVLADIGALKKANSKLTQMANTPLPPPPVTVPQTTTSNTAPIVVESKMLKDENLIKIQKMSYSTRGF
ncbi:putative OPA3-like protein CG13603 isoform X2 [Lucilia sericata]|uniref:putative OPA3-like protein CG13603 isoform X2 n=1 Tax=Lucilia sericata TaxID=13632 RepID=UPI0018A7E994|nr:putative OPA3-like protein CG13603 isoform X2 [Lucilia sericata]